MRKALHLLCAVIALSVATSVSSCKKRVHKVNEDYIGFWTGSDQDAVYSFEIEENSQGTWDRASYTGEANTNWTGPVKLRDDRLRCGPIKRFTVDQHPIQSGSTNEWTMMLDGVTYFTVK